MIQMISKTSSEKLRDLLDIKIKMSSWEAWGLILKGKLPNNVEVDGSPPLRNTRTTSLPEGLHIKGSLDLSISAIASLPGGLCVDGSLDLQGTKITSLPVDIVVGGDVYVSKKLKGKKPKGVKGKVVVG